MKNNININYEDSLSKITSSFETIKEDSREDYVAFIIKDVIDWETQFAPNFKYNIISVKSKFIHQDKADSSLTHVYIDDIIFGSKSIVKDLSVIIPTDKIFNDKTSLKNYLFRDLKQFDSVTLTGDNSIMTVKYLSISTLEDYTDNYSTYYGRNSVLLRGNIRLFGEGSLSFREQSVNIDEIDRILPRSGDKAYYFDEHDNLSMTDRIIIDGRNCTWTNEKGQKFTLPITECYRSKEEIVKQLMKNF